MDQITQGDKESSIDKKNRIASVGKSGVGKKILTSKEKNNNKRISGLTGTKLEPNKTILFFLKASQVYNKMKIKYWCAIHRMSLPLENISNSAAKNSSFNCVTKLPLGILKET